MVFDIIEGDRKAYYESAEWKMKENREKISKLRSENKELRKVKCDKLAVSITDIVVYPIVVWTFQSIIIVLPHSVCCVSTVNLINTFYCVKMCCIQKVNFFSNPVLQAFCLTKVI